METAKSTKSLKCVVVTPEKAVLDATVDFVAVPMLDGELGILPGRQPLIGRLGFGELRIVKDNATKVYYVDGGFAQVRGETVTLLTSKAVPAEQLTMEGAQAALREAQRPTAAPEEQDAKLRDQLRARAQLRIAAKASQMDDIAALRALRSQ